MRIVGGSLRGRRLLAPTDRSIRPTSDRLREALFDILTHRDEPLPKDAAVIDAFAGSGALGLEALSRGAARAAFLDTSPAALDLIRRNAQSLGLEDRALILRRDALRPGKGPFAADLIFMDPPYADAEKLIGPALRALIDGGWTRQGTLFAIESARRFRFAPPQECRLVDERAYGDTRLALVLLDAISGVEADPSAH